MSSIAITTPFNNSVVPPSFPVNGNYVLTGPLVPVNVTAVVNHPNGQQFNFGPVPGNPDGSYQVQCANLPPTPPGQQAVLQTQLNEVDNLQVLAVSPAVNISISGQ
jgi:hypothetical protein